jgi:hypothetical protein
MTGHRIGEVFGDLSEQLPVGQSTSWSQKAADALLTPSRVGHNIPRRGVYLGEEARAARQIAKFRAGEIVDPQELANTTGAWFLNEAPRSRLLAMAADPTKPIKEVADEFGKAFMNRTQFGDTQGQILQTGMGRLFGQYGSWPMSYLDFSRQLVARAFDNPVKGVPALASWMAINYGAFEGAQSLGIDAGKWLFFSPAAYSGSPVADFVKDVALAPSDSKEGLQARERLHQFPLEMVPGEVELNDIWKAYQDNDMSLPRLLGFKPQTAQQQQDWEDWLYQEGGFKKQQ